MEVTDQDRTDAMIKTCRVPRKFKATIDHLTPSLSLLLSKCLLSPSVQRSETWAQARLPVIESLSCVTTGKLLPVSMPQSSHLKIEGSINSMQFIS